MSIDKTVGEGKKRWILSIRTTADGRQRLVDSADANGRSLSEEIEARLQQTYQSDDAMGGFQNAAFVNLLGATIREAEAQTGKCWRSDPRTWEAVREAVTSQLEARSPAGAVTPARKRARKLPQGG